MFYYRTTSVATIGCNTVEDTKTREVNFYYLIGIPLTSMLLDPEETVVF
jgi:hypothetical protein